MGDLRQLRPGVWDRSRGVNVWLVLVLVGTLIVWAVLIIAMLRVMA
jgi:hypothetical protein